MNRIFSSTPVRWFAQLALLGAFLVVPMACGGSNHDTNAPAITTQPQGQSVYAGQTATFTVSATGDSLSYAWKKDGTAISGATSKSYTTPATVLADNGSIFTVTVSNSAGSVTSNGATLAVSEPLVIATAPSDQTVTLGQAATFTVAASGGTAPYTYQWQRQTPQVDANGIVSVDTNGHIVYVFAPLTSDGTGTNAVTLGAEATYTTLPTTPLDDGIQYQVKITDHAGATVTSDPVILHATSGFTNPVTEANYTLISPNYGSDNFYYVGRIDATTATAPVLIWEGTTVKAKFHGTSLGLKFGHPSLSWRHTYFDIIVDGEVRFLDLDPSKTNFTFMWNSTLADTDHDLTIFKRSEANETWVPFLGVYLDQNETALGTTPAAATKRIEFYGDSFTAGAYADSFPYDFDNGSLAYNSDQEPSAVRTGIGIYGMSTFDNYNAYGTITARALSADYSCIAVSGIGISLGWNGSINMPQVFDRLYYPDGNAPKTGTANAYDFANNPEPDVVVINLGQNDRGKSSSDGIAFPADFQTKYVAMVQAIRGFYPDAKIVCALGGMSAGQDATMVSNFDAAVATLQLSDSNIYSFKFTHWTNMHPRAFDQQILADELVTYLNTIF